ncbi:MAG: sigma-70 region 4 domain-containing protein, partial [Myxococcota bacterium]|nr:sigma-70 region 4 domain-containing protein [Myxococcota bacterium]
ALELARVARMVLEVDARARRGRSRRLLPLLEGTLVPPEVRAELQAALAHLDRRERQVVLLRDVIDLTPEQIARVLNLRVGTVRSRLQRGRTNFARSFSGRSVA